MQMMKKENGITMVMLVITVIVLTIISAIVIGYSINGIAYSQEKKLLSDLESVQQAVYEQYETYEATNDTSLLLGTEASDEEMDKAGSVGWEYSNASSLSKESRYYKVTPEQLEEMGLSEVEDTYIVNYKTGECFNLTKIKTGLHQQVLYID